MVDGGGFYEASFKERLQSNRIEFDICNYAENIGNRSFTEATFKEWLRRLDASVDQSKPGWVVFNEDDNRYFRKSIRKKAYVCHLLDMGSLAIVSSDSKNKFNSNEEAVISEFYGKELCISNWGAFGGMHLNTSIYGQLLNDAEALAKTCLAENGIFFDKIAHACLNRYKRTEINRKFVADVTQGTIARSGWLYPATHGIKTAW